MRWRYDKLIRFVLRPLSPTQVGVGSESACEVVIQSVRELLEVHKDKTDVILTVKDLRMMSSWWHHFLDMVEYPVLKHLIEINVATESPIS